MCRRPKRFVCNIAPRLAPTCTPRSCVWCAHMHPNTCFASVRVCLRSMRRTCHYLIYWPSCRLNGPCSASKRCFCATCMLRHPIGCSSASKAHYPRPIARRWIKACESSAKHVCLSRITARASSVGGAWVSRSWPSCLRRAQPCITTALCSIRSYVNILHGHAP